MEEITLDDIYSALNHLDGFQDWDPAMIEAYARLGLIDQLEKSPTPESIEILRKSCYQSPIPSIQKRAFEGLTSLALRVHQTAVQSLYTLAVIEDHLPSQLFLAEHLDLVEKPSEKSWILFFASDLAHLKEVDEKLVYLTEGLVNLLGSLTPSIHAKIIRLGQSAGFQDWLVLAEFLIEQSEADATRLIQAYPLFEPHLQELSFRWLVNFAEMGVIPAKEAICDLFIEYSHQLSKDIALKNNWLPAEAHRQALFLFLSEQWDVYNELDFDHSLLSTAFTSASDILKRRLLHLSRYTGQVEWLSTQRGRLNPRVADDLSAMDWQYIVQELSGANRWSDLFSLLKIAPPVSALQIIHLLEDSGFIPEETHSEWEKLSKIARQCKAVSLEPDLISENHFPSATYFDLAIAGNNTLAVSDSEGIDIWDISSGFKSKTKIHPPSLPHRTIALSTDGDYLVAGGNDNRIRIFRIADRQLVKTLEGHQAPIRHLYLMDDNRILLSASQDGILRTWRFPSGQILFTSEHSGNSELLRCQCALNGQVAVAAYASGEICSFILPSLKKVHQFQKDEDSSRASILLATSQNGELIAALNRNQNVFVWNISSKHLLQSFTLSDRRAIAITFDPSEQFLILGNHEGSVEVWEISTNKLLSISTSRSPSPIIAASMAHNEHLLVTLTAAGCLSLWDLSLLQLAYTPSQKINPVELRKLLAVPARKISENSKQWKSFIQTLIEWQHRYDIHIGEHEIISAGEYDIQL